MDYRKFWLCVLMLIALTLGGVGKARAETPTERGQAAKVYTDEEQGEYIRRFLEQLLEEPLTLTIEERKGPILRFRIENRTGRVCRSVANTEEETLALPLKCESSAV